MHDWLDDALQGTSLVVTANRRLARTLAEAYGAARIAAGQRAWRSPAIVAWADWLTEQYDAASGTTELPVRINNQQARIIWEDCLQRELADPLLNISMLVSQAQDAWNRLHEWCVTLEDCIVAALGRDQKIFASAASSYRSILRREKWVDEPGINAFVAAHLADGQAPMPASITLAGFDRITPATQAILDVLETRGVRVLRQTPEPQGREGALHSFESADAELRAAGSWARGILQSRPDARIAIISAGLEKDADRTARLVREGLVPGWQTGSRQHTAAVNVSYGRRLGAYPAIATAVLVLRWCVADLSSHDVSRLMRSNAIGRDVDTSRTRLELGLRNLPAQHWSPQRLLRALGDKPSADGNARDFLRRIADLAEIRNRMPAKATPSEWAGWMHEVLVAMNWPGESVLDSDEFQLVNRWRELLNELARLELVSPSMTPGIALTQLQRLVADTVFQPESDAVLLDLLGPLEAAGMKFDALWIAGMTASDWPPVGHATPLVSRQLQRERGMPDADPGDTLDYAERVLRRLAASTEHLVCSYALIDGDAEQSPSGLLPGIASMAPQSVDDPRWYAGKLVGSWSIETIAHDPVPAVQDDEKIVGGVAALQRQSSEPFAAFAIGRLGIRSLNRIGFGLPARTRGNLIHGALHRLYQELPDSQVVAAIAEDEFDVMLDRAVHGAFARLERSADEVLAELLRLEKDRVRELAREVVAIDAQRDGFRISKLEYACDAVIAKLALSLRIDRIDVLESGELQVFDYKTGKGRQFLTSGNELADVQLVLYALALDAPISDLAYFNVDTRSVDINGAGREFTPDLDWEHHLDRWKDEVVESAIELREGDVRLWPAQSSDVLREFALLSRIRELLQDVR